MEYAEARLRIFGTPENDEKLRNNNKTQWVFVIPREIDILFE